VPSGALRRDDASRQKVLSRMPRRNPQTEPGINGTIKEIAYAIFLN